MANKSFGIMNVRRGVSPQGRTPRKPQARGMSFAGGGIKPAARALGGASLRKVGGSGSSRALVRRGFD